MNKLTVFLVAILWILSSHTTTLLAQIPPLKFERLGLEHGLSQSTVYCILQDRQGFMWFGTQAGLNKFDGYKFTVYQQDVFDSTSLAQNVNNVMGEDHTGTLWFGSGNEAVVNRFEPETERFTRFKHDPNNPHSLSDGGVAVIFTDHTGSLWVGTSFGLNRFDREKERFTRFIYDPKDSTSLHGYSVFSIHEGRDSTLWIGTGRWLNKFDREHERFVHYEHDPQHPRNRKARQITAMFEDRSGVLWLGTEGAGLKKFDRANGRFTDFLHDPTNAHSLSSDSVRTIFEDRCGALWIGTWNGLNLFDREQENFLRYLPNPKNPNSLSDSDIWDIYEDRSGILWVGTFLGGLNKLDRGREQFTKVTHDPNNPHSLSNNGAIGFFKDRSGTLWVGTQHGLNRLDATTKQFTSLFHDPKNANSLCDNTVFAVFDDHLGMLWLGTRKGLDKFDPVTKRFTHYTHDPNNPHSLSSDLITVIYEDRDRMLWIGTFGGGLNKFDRERNRFTRFVHDATDSNSINGNYVWAVCEDSLARNILWVAADGVNRFDRDTEQFTHFTTKNGLPDDQICGILEDDHGRLWLSTGNGISCFGSQTKTFRNYGVADGLASNSFFMPSQHKSFDSEMFFGSERGFTRFHPDSIKDNPYIPPVVITAFKRYNTDDAEGVAIEEKGLSAKQEVTVSYQDNVLNFEFTALSYRNTFKNQYAYKLEGFNDNWIQLGTKHDVTFTNLDPGEYTLRVKGSNNDGVWNEEGASLKITVTPPWWQTRWAYAAYFMLFAAALYGWRRFELNRVKLRNELRMKNFEAQKLQEMDHMKSRFFANISHEFRTPLTLILGPVEQMNSDEFKGNVKEAYEMILRNGRRLLRLINQLLDLARLEAGRMSLQARPENIVSFLKGLVLSFASAAERKRIALSITAEEENLIVYFDRDKLEKIVSNLLSNALKFTPEEGLVAVAVGRGSSNQGLLPGATASATAGFVEICVTDNGPGIPADQLGKIFDRFHQVVTSRTSTSSVQEHEGTGIGLALTKELVELHHGEISVESEVGRGATFIVRLPLGKEHLKADEVLSDQLSVTSHQFARFEDRGLQIENRVSSIEDRASSGEPIILIVEDNRDVCTYIRQYLEPAFKVIEAYDGVAGVQVALEIIPDLIITDVMMPKRDGNELCRILKTDEKTSHVPIIMLTAKADSESKVHGLETGADDYLIKPFNAEELLARVHNLIKLRRQLRERFSREIVLKPQDIAITPRDEIFLNKVKAVVEKYLGDEEFEVETLSREVGMSHSQIHRKLKALTNQSASQFIRSMRLARAVELLKQDAGTVAEIAYQVGFGSQAYFTKCFHEQFGYSPKEYVKKNL